MTRGPGATPPRWAVTAALAGSALMIAVAVAQFVSGHPGFGWGLLGAAALCSGGYVVPYWLAQRSR